MKFSQFVPVLISLAGSALAQDFCSSAQHTGESVTETSNNVGSIGDVGYELWADSGSNSATFYSDGSFSCSMQGAGDYLCRTGLSFDSTQTPSQIGQLTADFKVVKENISNVGYSYVGIYGWTRDPLVEYYIVDNWFSPDRPGDWVGNTNHGDFQIDGATYTVYENDRTGPSIDGDTTFKQYFSIRSDARECGTIDISAHFAQWESLGMTMGKLHEAKVLGEAGNGSGGVSGTADFPYAKVYVGGAAPAAPAGGAAAAAPAAAAGGATTPAAGADAAAAGGATAPAAAGATTPAAGAAPAAAGGATTPAAGAAPAAAAGAAPAAAGGAPAAGAAPAQDQGQQQQQPQGDQGQQQQPQGQQFDFGGQQQQWDQGQQQQQQPQGDQGQQWNQGGDQGQQWNQGQQQQPQGDQGQQQWNQGGDQGQQQWNQGGFDQGQQQQQQWNQGGFDQGQQQQQWNQGGFDQGQQQQQWNQGGDQGQQWGGQQGGFDQGFGGQQGGWAAFKRNFY